MFYLVVQRTQHSVKVLPLELAKSKVVYAAPALFLPRAPPGVILRCSVTNSASLAFWQLLFSTIFGAGRGELPEFPAFVAIRDAPTPRRDRVTTATANQSLYENQKKIFTQLQRRREIFCYVI